MKAKIVILAAITIAWADAAYGQNSIENVLRQVEANNKTLYARASLAEADMLAEKMGNSLPDPEVAYEHMWGTRAVSGQKGEVTATQSFDFPTAYIERNRLAELRGKKYASEYDLYRQQVLLETYELCVELIFLRNQAALFKMRAAFSGGIADAAARKLESGEINAMQATEARIHWLAARNEIRIIEVEIADAVGRLKILNGGLDVDFPDTEFPAADVLPPFEDMAAVYLESDPELAIALAEYAAAKQEVRASRSESLPKLTAGYKLEHGGRERFNGVVAGVSIPMFGNRNNVKRARAQERFASLQAENAKMSVERRLATLYNKATLLEESIISYEDITEDTAEYLDNLSKALAAGQINITDYYSRYDALIESEKALIELKREYHIVRARIYSVML